jgi:hypothetical protein
MTNNWPPPSADPSPPNWAPPQGAPAANPWQQQGYGQQPAYGQQPDDRAMEWVLPINRSGLAIAAGYVALCSFPVLIAGPIGVLLGVLALGDLRRNPYKRGKGRAWFAIVYGGLGTLALLLAVSRFFFNFF